MPPFLSPDTEVMGISSSGVTRYGYIFLADLYGTRSELVAVTKMGEGGLVGP